ncbi:hypothetical protein [Burkholderia ubonensis]
MQIQNAEIELLHQFLDLSDRRFTFGFASSDDLRIQRLSLRN